MPNIDITRELHQPGKHYSGARLQQGRPVLDSDFVEDADPQTEDIRQVALDAVGPSGSPDFGFLPDLNVGDRVTARLVQFGALSRAWVLDYRLNAGTLYAGGTRWEQPEAESILFQREFLQMGTATAPRAGVGRQRQMLILRGHLQPVTATEDSELLEPAMGGADGAARLRKVRRVEAYRVEAEDCSSALAEVLEDLGNGDSYSYDPDTCELRSNARLQIRFHGSPASDCEPCNPIGEGRYLLSEGHAIRIMLTGPDRYVWAFDNAAPLYRVRLVLDDVGGGKVEMLTPPKDAYHHPRQHDIVEFLPWEALLNNGKAVLGKGNAPMRNERVAAPIGFIAEADAPYDPSTRRFHVNLNPVTLMNLGLGKAGSEAQAEAQATQDLKSNSVPARDGIALEWDPSHPLAFQLNPFESTSEGFVAHVYMRVWHSRQSGQQLGIPTSSLAPMGQSGLVPVFSGKGNAGDHWTVTVRPEAPDEVLPRQVMLDGGIAPLGPRAVVAPISLIEWSSLFGTEHEVVTLHHCRPPLPSLTDRGCCTFEVGQNADFESVQEAIDALPPGGGRICIQPGEYPGAIRLKGRSDVVISGCPEQTLIVPPMGDEGEPEALIDLDLEGQENLKLQDLAVRSFGAISIRVSGGRNVELSNLEIMCGRDDPVPSAVQVLGTENFRLLASRVFQSDQHGDHAAVFLHRPDRALVEGCRVGRSRGIEGGPIRSWGGIHVAGGSRDVEIRDNVITGGRGHGITLGSIAWRSPDGSTRGVSGAGEEQSGAKEPFELHGFLPSRISREDPETGETFEFFPEVQPAIEDLLIVDNLISGAGGSGISSLAIEVGIEDEAKKPPLCYRRSRFQVGNLTIAGNRILDNATEPWMYPPPAEIDALPPGGVVLCDLRRATIRNNEISGNGLGGRQPSNGIYVVRSEDVMISGNHLHDNQWAELDRPAREARSALVYAGVVVTPAGGLAAPAAGGEWPLDIHVRNNVVKHPGTALCVICRGSCRLTGNFLASEPIRPFSPGVSAIVLASGRPWEAVDLPQGEPSPDRWVQPAGSFDFLSGRAQQETSVGGSLLFHGNQVATTGPLSPGPIDAFGAFLFSTDHTSVLDNQFTAGGPDSSPHPQGLFAGATAAVCGNRVAESVNMTEASIGTVAPMLTAVAGNQLTHCPAVVGCSNNFNPDYYREEANLVWLTPVDGGCRLANGSVRERLHALCASAFGTAFQDVRPGLVAVDRPVILGPRLPVRRGTFAVQGVTFMFQERQPMHMQSPAAKLRLDQGQGPYAMEIRFTDAADRSSVVLDKTFLVRERPGDAPVDGQLVWTTSSVIRFTAEKGFPTGSYQITLRGSVPAIRGLSRGGRKGPILDGDQNELWPTGDGKPGGDFQVAFVVR